MPVDRAIFAEECVRQGLHFGVNPHYLVSAAQFQSGISDDSQNDQTGPFRLSQTAWDANSISREFEVNFQPSDIKNWRAQCAVFALMALRAFSALISENSRPPSAL